MAFKDILLTLTSYPDPTPASVAEDAVAIAATLGAHLAAVACEVHVEVPGHFLSGTTANIPGIIAGETEKSRNSARAMLAAFDAVRREIRHSARNPTRKMLDLRGPGSAGRPRAASRPHHRAGAGRLRPVVRRSRDIRIGAAYPRSAREPARAPVRTRDRRRRLGFQPCRGACCLRCHAAARKGQEGADRHRHQRKETGHQAFRRSTGQEPRSPRHRRGARQGRCQRHGGSARCSKPTPFRIRSTSS